MLTRPSRTRRLALAGALCAALLGAGCGDGDEDKTKDYRQGLTEADRKFEQEITQAQSTMQAAGQAKSAAQYGEGVEQLQTAIEEFKGDLEDLETPQDAENEEEAVAEALDDFSEAVGRINKAVQEEDQEQTRAEVASVQTSGVAVDQAIKTLKDAVD